jgi:hypothetical protein
MKPSKTATFFVLYVMAYLVALTTMTAPGTAPSSAIVIANGPAIGLMVPSFLFIVGTRNWTNRSWIAPTLALLVWGGLVRMGT